MGQPWTWQRPYRYPQNSKIKIAARYASAPENSEQFAVTN